MKFLLFIFSIFLISCSSPNPADVEITKKDSKTTVWNYSDNLDAVVAAPKSHLVLIENEDVRVLRVIINPGEKEPMHTHKWKSIMYVEQAAKIKYYNENDELVFETPADRDLSGEPEPNWMGPEGLHAVENIDTVVFSALRVELKQ